MDMAKPKIRFKGYQDDWEQRKLGDYCDMYNGDRSSKYPNAQDMVVEGIPFINAGDLENGHVNLTTCNKISREKYDDLGGAKLQLGDIVYCLRGTLGKNAYIDNFPEGTVASSLVAIRPKNIDGRYLFHVLNSDIEYRQRVVHDEGAAQPNLSAKSVSGFMIPIPHIDEQKKVSEYFDNLDHLITLHQRKCDEAKKIKKFMLQKMFPQNGSRVPEIRFDGFTDDWEQRKLRDVLTLLKDGTHGTHKDTESGPLLLSAKNIKNGIVQWDESDRRISVDEYKSIHANFELQDGDVLLTIVGSIGETAILSHSEGITFQRSVAFLRPSNEIISEFLYSEIQGHEFQKELNDRKSTSAQPGIYLGDLGEIPINYPINIDEQTAIGQCFTTLDHLITLHQQKCTDLKNLKKYMLQNMFI